MERVASEIQRLYDAVVRVRAGAADEGQTAELLDAGSLKIAKKVVEESAEVSLAYVQGNDAEIVRETADLLYNLIVLLVERGISLDAVWEEMASREAVLGIAGKVPKALRAEVAEVADNGD